MSQKTSYHIWDKVFKNGLNKICGSQPLTNLKGYDLLKSSNFLKAVFRKFDLVHSWILCSILHYLSRITVSMVNNQTRIWAPFDPFHVSGLLLYPLKTLENLNLLTFLRALERGQLQRSVTFIRGGCNFSAKNKLKSWIFNDKRSL